MKWQANLKNCLIITLSNIGDLIMTTPIFEALNKSFPGIKINAVGDKRSSILLEFFPYVDQIFNKNKKANLREMVSFINLLRQIKYDLILDLRTPFLPFLLRGRKRLMKFSTLNKNEHSVYQHFSILQGILPDWKNPPPCRLYLPKTVEIALDLDYGLNSDSKLFVVAPGANWSEKIWPGVKFGKLIRAILDKKIATRVILLGSDFDAKIKLDLEMMVGNVLDLRGKTKLLEAASIMNRAKLFIGNDSGLGHMAASVGCKTLTLFGPGNYQRYRPWHSEGSVLLSPNSKLENLAVDDVLKKVEGIVSCG